MMRSSCKHSVDHDSSLSPFPCSIIIFILQVEVYRNALKLNVNSWKSFKKTDEPPPPSPSSSGSPTLSIIIMKYKFKWSRLLIWLCNNEKIIIQTQSKITHTHTKIPSSPPTCLCQPTPSPTCICQPPPPPPTRLFCSTGSSIDECSVECELKRSSCEYSVKSGKTGLHTHTAQRYLRLLSVWRPALMDLFSLTPDQTC